MTIDRSLTIKAIAFDAKGQSSFPVESILTRRPHDWTVKVISGYSTQYTGGGENAIVVVSGANAALTALDDESRRRIEDGRYLVAQFERPIELISEAFVVARGLGIQTVLTPAPVQMVDPGLLQLVDVLIPNAQEACELAGVDDETEAALALSRTVGLVVMTRGSRGALVARDGAVLHEVPPRKVEPVEFMTELLDQAEEEKLDASNPTALEAALHEVLDMMACKAAVKAGDKLTAEELAALLRKRDEIERSSNCPHGRPTLLRIGLELAPIRDKVAASVEYVRSKLGEQAWDEGMHPELPPAEQIENPYTYTEGDAKVTAAGDR